MPPGGKGGGGALGRNDRAFLDCLIKADETEFVRGARAHGYSAPGRNTGPGGIAGKPARPELSSRPYHNEWPGSELGREWQH